MAVKRGSEDPEVRRLFRRDARHPFPWAFEAECLRDAALILWTRHREDRESFRAAIDAGIPPSEIEMPEPSTTFAFKPALMLAALGIENLVKGLLIVREPSLVTESGLAGILQTHRIKSLLDRAMIPLDPDEEEWAIRVERVVLWAGRYPFSLVPEADDDKLFAKKDPEVFARLFLKINRELEVQARKRACKECRYGGCPACALTGEVGSCPICQGTQQCTTCEGTGWVARA